MPASYRREVEYDRTRTSSANPEPIALEDDLMDRGCSNCGEPNVDGVCVLCWGANEEDYRHVLEPEYF